MARRKVKRVSRQAVWSKRIALFTIQLLVATVLLHRFGILDTQTSVVLLAAGLLGALVALILGFFGVITVWRRGLQGAGAALASFLIAAAILAYPFWMLPGLFALPAITDVTTDTGNPPQFKRLALRRQSNTNPVEYRAGLFAAKQRAAYPDIRPMLLERSSQGAFEVASEAVRSMGWEIIVERAPDEVDSTGKIEAVARTRIMGFKDDIAVRITGDESAARIDIRSASRHGRHDLGANAVRIRALLAAMEAQLAAGELAGGGGAPSPFLPLRKPKAAR